MTASVVKFSKEDVFHQTTMSKSKPAMNPATKMELQLEDYYDHILLVYPTDVQNPLVNQHMYHFLLDNETVCEEDVFLLALIKSSPERIKERQTIRSTWASVQNYNGQRFVPLFIMGKVNNDTIQRELEKESANYGDIIQGAFTEHFRNQTYKSIMALTWMKLNCEHAQFLLITKDNTMVNPYHLVDFLLKQTLGQAEELLYCSTLPNSGPVRNPADKLYVSRFEYPYSKLPPHCEGFAYVMSRKVSSRLLQAAETVPFLWLDDVYVTGMLPLKANVKYTDMLPEHGYNLMQDEHLKQDIGKSMFLLANYRSLKSNWDKAWELITRHIES